ncbi:MAG: protein translocase subunit SecF [Deltaproteobacteria bacterium]|jgi:preprotein translocase subunit SecF|nr:protein translocase subunit SecF [Deltaproteobacteria bacterium]
MSLEIIKPGVNIDFIGRRRLAFAVSACLLLASVVSIVWHGGLNLGVDFRGGLLIQARLTDQSVNPARLREVLTAANLEVSSIQAFGEAGEAEYLINISGGTTAEGQTLTQAAARTLNDAFGADNVDLRREEMVGPKVGDDLQQKALNAIYYSLLMIIIYISGRFEKKWLISAVFVAILLGALNVVRLFGVGVAALIVTALIVTIIACYFLKFSFALGGILALLHDVVITTGVFSILGKEITLSFVAAVLTIIGYSLNDSIIVFDRIRENNQRLRKLGLPLIINRSINETLSRTILTSGTTVLALICLYCLGGPVNRDFALALLIGVSVGTLSSIFIASPLLLLWENKQPQKA